MLNIKTIDKIYHVSDIHLRNFKRHDEYKRVFKRLADFIKKDKTENSIICVTGDIVHSKTDITPELVQETQDFFKLMSSLLPTIVIPGNHDANLNNNNRLDSLTPIINAIDDKNIVYIKDTGVYKIGNISFIHWSVFDEKEHYIKADSLTDSDIKICLYHGPVNNSEIGIDFKLSGNCIDICDFEGFDFALLGDIHKMQYLNSNKTIAYPGSLIQQNHSESLNHGILVWDINKKTSEFIEIKNDTAFFTLYVENGIHLDLPEELPKNLYLRLRSKNTSQSEIKSIVSNIKKTKKIVELSHQKMTDFSTSELNNHENIINVRDVKYQNELLTKYLKSKFEISDSDIQKVCELNRSINNDIQKTELIRNIQWVPKRFEFSNMFSFGKNNIIDFSNMEGIFGIFAENASGKSSSIEALVYCLFDKCSKTSKAGMVMNNKSKEFQCKLDFELSGRKYTIERRASYRPKSENVKQDVDFYYLDENENKISLNGKDRSDTNSIIRGVIGTYEDFILTSMSMQNNNTGFIDMGQSDRKDLLSQFLDIKVFEDLNALASEKIKEYSVLIKEYRKVDYFDIIKEIEKKIEDLQKNKKDLDTNKLQLEKSIDEKNNDYIKLNSQLINVEKEYYDIEKINKSLIDAENKNKSIKDNIANIEIQIQTIDNNIANNEKLLSQYDINSIQKEVEKLPEHIQKEKEISLKVENLKSEIFHKMEKMDKLKTLEYDENCQFCMNNVFVKDAIQTRDSIENDKKKAAIIVDELKSERLIIDNLKQYQLKLDEYNKIDRLNTKEKNELERLKLNNQKANLELHQNEKLIESIENTINQYKEKEAAINANKEILKNIEIVTKELQSLKNANQEINKLIVDYDVNIQILEKDRSNCLLNIEKLKQLEEKFKYYEYYLSAVSRDGLPYEIISSAIPKIQDSINNILTQVVDFQISIKSDGKNINAYIVYDDSKMWPIELCSGMEKFVSSLAIRSALINITSLPRPNFLAIDEGFGALDQSNMGNISILLDYLKTQFKFIIMISHIDSIRDVVDSHIEIVKDSSGFSKVCYE